MIRARVAQSESVETGNDSIVQPAWALLFACIFFDPALIGQRGKAWMLAEVPTAEQPVLSGVENAFADSLIAPIAATAVCVVQ